MTAAALLREAWDAGVRLRAEPAGRVKVRARLGDLPPALLDRLRVHKLELAEILRGDRCRWCGGPMRWPHPDGIVEAAGTALHHGCYEAEDVARLRRLAANASSPEALADPAEFVVRGEELP